MDREYQIYGEKHLLDLAYDSCEGLTNRKIKYIQEELCDDSEKNHRVGQNSQDQNKNTSIVYLSNKPILINGDSKQKKEYIKILDFEKWMGHILDDSILLRPSRLAIDASTLCQLNCADCYMRKRNYDGVGKGSLSLDTLKKIVEEYPYIKEIELSNNGEALLAPQIIQILEYLHKHEIAVTFCNGVNFNYASDELIDSLVQYDVKQMSIAIDGATQETYGKYRQNGNIEKVINNIKKLNESKMVSGSEHPKLIWQYILMSHNECDIPIAKKLAKELNMDIYFKIPWGDYSPCDVEYVKNETGLKSLTRDIDYFWGLRCRDLLFKPHINWDGRLLGCCSSHTYDFGINVFETGIEAALNSDIYRSCVKNVFLRSDSLDISTPCGKCNIYKEHILYE